MKVFIMAGGFGTRLGDIAKDIPKALLTVSGKPVLDYLLEKLEFLDGLDTIYLSTNKKFEPPFREWLEGPKPSGIRRVDRQPSRAIGTLENLRPKIRLVVEPVLSEQQKFGAVGAWRHLLWKERLNDDIISIAGDNLFTFDLGIFLAKARSLQAPVVVLHDVQKKEEARKFGVCAVNPHHRITSFEEKPEEPKSTLVSTGIYYFPAATLPTIEHYLAGGNSRDSPGRFLAWLSKRMPVYGFIPLGQWVDIGSPESYERAQGLFRP